MKTKLPTVSIQLDLSPFANDLPDWVRYIAIDSTGEIYGYSTRPVFHGPHTWLCDGDLNGRSLCIGNIGNILRADGLCFEIEECVA
jgi:hypothetical protein